MEKEYQATQRHWLLVIAAALYTVFGNIDTYAQVNENRIFLWDVSESLILPRAKGGTEMWDELKNALVESISAIPEDSQNKITLVPFYDSPLGVIEVNATKDGKNQILDSIAKRECLPIGSRKTNIVDAVRKFHQLADANNVNYMFLYTDGENEIGDLCSELSSWDAKSAGKKCYAFYVLVDPKAMNGCVENAAETQHNFWIVKDAKKKVSEIALRQNIAYNLRQDKEANIKVTGDLNGFKGGVNLISEDGNITAKVKNADIANGVVTIELMPQVEPMQLPNPYKLKLKVEKTGDDPYSFVTPQEITVNCINKPERTLKISIK